MIEIQKEATKMKASLLFIKSINSSALLPVVTMSYQKN